MLPTIDIQDDVIVMVDQRKLPAQEVYVRCRTTAEVAKAIRTMVIRGAPAIGVAAAYGIARGMKRSTAKGTNPFAVDFQKSCDLMSGTRPTAKSPRACPGRGPSRRSRTTLAPRCRGRPGGT